jgi:hypothetical protein
LARDWQLWVKSTNYRAPSIAVRFNLNEQTPDRRGFYDAMCQRTKPLAR